MIKIENVVLPSPEQWEAVIRGMRNPKNSWDKSDSYTTHIEDVETLETADYEFFVGENDLDLMERLAKGGSVHAKYRRMIPVYLDITAPLYWWKEFDTYKVGTVANSCSTMHKIHEKEFEYNDFSWEHLSDLDDLGDHFINHDALEITIDSLNYNRTKYLETKSKPMKDEAARKKLMKGYWYSMIQLLPSSYNQKRTIFLNYEVLASMYRWRKIHKLNEWREFCEWIESLPYAHLITGIKHDLIIDDIRDISETAK